MKIIQKFPLIHPLLLAVFPILFLYSQNKGGLLPGDLLVPIIGVSILTLLFMALWFLLSLIFKSKEKAALLTSASILLFFSHGHLYDSIKGFGIHLGSFVFGENKILFTSYALILLILGYLLLRTRRDLSRLTNLVNLIALLLILFSAVDIIPYEIAKIRNTPSRQQSSVENNDLKNAPSKAKFLPDIYYIVWDGYARNDILKSLFNYDNSEFTNYLKEKGFYVASKSNSNYTLTGLSLPTALHMGYIDSIISYLAEKLGVEPNKLQLGESDIRKIEENQVVPFLKSQGYKFINLSNGWVRTEHNKYADINLGTSYFLKIRDKFLTLSEFSIVFLRTTALKPFLEPQIAGSARQKMLQSFEKLTEIPNMVEPTFVLAHYMMPHPPYLFDRSGNPVPKAGLELAGDVFEDKKHYLDQLIFASKKTKEIVDAILSKSANPPIIIIQSDHGSFSLLGSPAEWSSRVSKDAIRERMGILNAYYLPHGGDTFLYDSITPVNTFRLIFNFYFGANYDLLPDKSYFSCYNAAKCDFEYLDVTETVKSSK